jgi:hypothetical protein
MLLYILLPSPHSGLFNSDFPTNRSTDFSSAPLVIHFLSANHLDFIVQEILGEEKSCGDLHVPRIIAGKKAINLARRYTAIR